MSGGSEYVVALSNFRNHLYTLTAGEWRNEAGRYMRFAIEKKF